MEGRSPRGDTTAPELFYKSPTHLVVAEVMTDPTFAVVGEQVLFDITGHQSDLEHRRYDVTPDGKRFLMIRNVPLEGQGENPVLVLNFFEELRAKVGGK